MATFGAVKTAIARRLLDENHTAITDVEIGEAINESISFWKHKRFLFNVASSVLTIASGDSTITILPSDFLADIPRNALVITFSSEVYQVKQVSPAVFDGLRNTTSTGRPHSYCYRNGVIEFYPTADREYSAKLYYIKDYDDFTTSGTQDSLTNDFLTHAQSLIQNHALANLHGELRQDFKMEDRYTQRAEIEFNNLRNKVSKSLRTGTLTIEQ